MTSLNPLSPALWWATRRAAGRLTLAAAATALAGCNTVVMNPSGDIARQQADLITTATWLMLLIIVPVIALTGLFAWRYRAANTQAPYEPEWDHSTRLELVIWGAPLLIIIALGALTWISTHQLDPYRPLSRIDENRPLPADVQPLEVQVVALDWKWLFIYPEQGIATVNELAAPVDRPIRFRLTASTVMNSFFVPALAGQIYTMPGMQTTLHAVINEVGVYDGFSANYSGDGFSHMRFRFHGLDNAGFEAWVARNRREGGTLSRAAYLALERPSERTPVTRFAQVDPQLYSAIVDRCVDRQKMCMGQMMAIDAAGGGGKAGMVALREQAWRNGQQTVVAGLCTVNDPMGLGSVAAAPANAPAQTPVAGPAPTPNRTPVEL